MAACLTTIFVIVPVLEATEQGLLCLWLLGMAPVCATVVAKPAVRSGYREAPLKNCLSDGSLLPMATWSARKLPLYAYDLSCLHLIPSV